MNVRLQYRVLLASGLLVVPAALISTTVSAQEYPTRPIRLIVPFPPGGGTDIVARTLAQKLSESLGQQVVVDNRGGAGGNIGAEVTARAPADGYTLFMASATHTINMTLYSKLAYDVVKDFAAVSLAASLPYTLVSHPALPVRSAADLVRLAKSRPGQLNYPSAGSGTGTHLAMEIFKSAAGIDIVHVPYKGSAPALTDILSGQMQTMFGNTAAVLPQIKGSRLRALAVTGKTRSAQMPDVPTISETVVPGFEVIQWYGILVPAGTPEPVIRRLNGDMQKAVDSRELRERLANEGADPVKSTPQEFSAFIRAEVTKWAKAVKSSGARVD